MNDLESLLARALDAVVGMDQCGRVTAWNRTAEEIFGWSRSEVIGARLGDLIVPPEHREAHERGLEHYNRTGEGPVLETRIRIDARHRDGHRFPIELSIFPMKEDGGRRIFYGFMRSLAAEVRHRREQELRTREAEILLQVADKLLEDISFEDFTLFCLEEVCALAGLHAGHLFTVRGSGRERTLVPSNIWHISERRFAPVIDATRQVRLGYGEGLPGRAWREGSLVYQPDLASDLGFARRDAFSGAGLTCGIALPVLRGGNVHAVLEFFGTEASRFDPDILRLVRTVGSQIGLAIQRKHEAERRETLRGELAHRVSNSLTILASIYRNCARSAATIEDLSAAFLGRLTAVGNANRLAIQEADQSVELVDLVREAIGLVPESGKVPVDVPALKIASDMVMPLSLVLNELATNALKHGDHDSGDLALMIRGEIDADSGDLVLYWHERRTEPLSADPTARVGFGSRLISGMIEGRLGGRFERHIDACGCRVQIRVPLGVAHAPAAAQG
ncbi:PAS domain S-box protein [Rhodobacteraceae bacterium 2CG4]|uniref:histidine kinase n=1 Tax=Halovulum marinum TaxID=2662447 RepID=A0A6L5YV58_9RHOB|nr:PAS domain S-box protein [Halovulum marinum]MSU88171.1 PAS domain S-box protein [Halovulum marinum]